MIALLAATCTLAAAGQLPDQHCTPGTLFTTVTQTNIDRTICVPGWSSAHRKVSSSTRARVYASYGLTGDHPFPEWEVDHRVPLEPRRLELDPEPVAAARAGRQGPA